MHDADEVWKTIPDFGDCYGVSNRGRVKRLKGASGTKPGRICKPAYLRGYARYRLTADGSRGRMFNAHRLVYEVFIGPIPDGMQINHKNGIKGDNRIENLEVVSASENKLHAHRVLGLPGNINSMPGENNPKAKITWNQVRAIRRQYASGEWKSQQAVATEFGLNQSTIGRIVRGEIWKETDTA